jgi:hypothetical protein
MLQVAAGKKTIEYGGRFGRWVSPVRLASMNDIFLGKAQPAAGEPQGDFRGTRHREQGRNWILSWNLRSIDLLPVNIYTADILLTPG